MLENPKRLPVDQDPNPDDDDSKVVPLNDQLPTIRKRVQLPTKNTVGDIMGKIRERDKSALEAKKWIENKERELKELRDNGPVQ